MKKIGTYGEGYEEGYKSATIVLKPLADHTSEYDEEVLKTYADSIRAETPNPWLKGFGDGFETKCRENRENKKQT